MFRDYYYRLNLSNQLNNYATKDDISNMVETIDIEDVVRNNELSNQLNNYATKNDVSEMVENEDIEDVVRNSDITDVVRENDLNNQLNEYAKKNDLPDVSDFITLEEVPEVDLSSYAKTEDIPSIEGLLDEPSADELYVTRSEVGELQGPPGKDGTVEFNELTEEQKTSLIFPPKIYTRDEYDQLTPDPNTLYFIEGV